eukprot:jgi/Astpho2/110/Aster-x0006
MAAALSAIKCRLKACKLWAMLLPFLTDYVRSLVLQPVLGHGQDEREQQVRADLAAEKEQLRKHHDRELRTLREQYENSQEGWRAAVAERARQELASREAVIRADLTKQRDAELETVIERLEGETAAACAAAERGAATREAALQARCAAEVQQAQSAEAQNAERFRVASEALAAAGKRADDAERSITDLEQHIQNKRTAISELQDQVAQLQEQVSARDATLRNIHAARDQQQQQLLLAMGKDKQELDAQARLLRGSSLLWLQLCPVVQLLIMPLSLLVQVAAAQRQLVKAHKQHQQEMAQLEDRVRTAVAAKDDSIAALRQQLEASQQQVQALEGIMQQQQAELCA